MEMMDVRECPLNKATLVVTPQTIEDSNDSPTNLASPPDAAYPQISPQGSATTYISSNSNDLVTPT